MTNFGEYSGEIQLAGVGGNSRAFYNQYNGIANFLPRIGAAWTPFGDENRDPSGILAVELPGRHGRIQPPTPRTHPGISIWWDNSLLA